MNFEDFKQDIKQNKNAKYWIIGGIVVIIGLAVFFASCGGEKPQTNDPLANFKPNKAELGEDWKIFRHDTSFNVWVFPDNEPRPAEHKTPKGARVFWNGDVTGEELSIIDDGLGEMLAACRSNNSGLPIVPNAYTKFLYFQAIPDYKLIFVKSNYTLQEGEAAGCAGMITGAHGTITAAGTVGGLVDRFNSTRPASLGGIYIIIPKQSPEQLAKAECKNLMKNAVRNEAEHVWMTNDSMLYFGFANDGVNGNHPYCRMVN